MESERKALIAVEVKDADKGIVTAKFAELDVKDHDGDIIESGAFGDQKVRVSSFGHASWFDGLPVGKGTIHEKGNDAIADLGFFMDTQIGREHFGVIKGLGDLGEWSFGFDIKEQATPDEDQRQKGVVRILKKLIVHEVSPVLKGAGLNTGTLSVKEKTEEAKLEAEPNKLRCTNCAYFIGEASSPLLWVGMAPSHAKAKDVVSLPRDIRLCKGCGMFNIYIPRSVLTASGS